MVKMKDRNAQLKNALGAIAPRERVVEALNVPNEDAKNRQNHDAYALSDEFRLVTMLNTTKLNPQFYRTPNDTIRELRSLIERVAVKDPYFVAQAIVYSRCVGEGLRSVNHLAAALLAPFASGTEWGRRFYTLFDKRASKNGVVSGGCIFRADDMSEIKDAYCALNKSALSNAMKKGFADAITRLDTYAIAKYKKTVMDITNLVHPNTSKSKATINVNGEIMNAIDALMRGINISADTWETAQSEAGQCVARAVREGKLDEREAQRVLAEAKNDNWETLMRDGKLGILAALRNIRNILTNARASNVDALCELLTREDAIRRALVNPLQIDIAYEVIRRECLSNEYTPRVLTTLQNAFVKAIPNLANALTGRTCVIVDCSYSMGTPFLFNGSKRTTSRSFDESCSKKAGLIAATIAKATHADVIKFGTYAEYFDYDANMNVFDLGRAIGTDDFGGTNAATAFELMRKNNKAYDRIIFISDNEINGRLTSDAYRSYIHDVCSSYVYAIDLAAYGTTPLKSDKVSYHFGYGMSLFEDIAANEFNAGEHLDKIRRVII